MTVLRHNTRTRSTKTWWFVVSIAALFLVAAKAQESSVVVVAAAEEESSSTTDAVGVGDDYSIAEGNRSLMVALGCFWCAEQAFEQYAPGVIEAVSGYAGGINDNPTYRNHPGHYEVILIEYDPSKTSYDVLVNYAYRNMDPFDGTGQFCDKGSSYYPAIFYATEEERLVAEDVLEAILMQNNWDEADIEAPILPRPVFWTAEDYHQDYYIKNPAQYGYYKNACRRPQRLEEVWGKDEYKCYHEEAHTCFVTADTVSSESNSDNSTSTGTTTTSTTSDASGDDGSSEPQQQLQITNADGELVAAESNIKMVEPEKAALLPTWATAMILVTILGLVLLLASHLALNKKRHNNLFKTDSHRNEAARAIDENVDANHAKPASAATDAALPSEAPKQEPEEAV